MVSIHELVFPVIALVVLVVLVGVRIAWVEALYLCGACLVAVRYAIAAWRLRKD